MGNYTTRRTDQDVLDAIRFFLQHGEGVPTRKIAEHVQCCTRTVEYAIVRLQNAGKLEITDSKAKPNRYRIIQ